MHKQFYESMEELESGNKRKCLSCGMEYEGNFCPNCGQSAKVGRLSLKRVLTEALPDIYNLDNRFLRTCIDLFRRPGHMIKDYIEGNRAPYYKPVSLLFVVATIYLIVAHLFQIETGHDIDISKWFSGEVNGERITFIEEDSMLFKVLGIMVDIYNNQAWSILLSITILVIPIKLSFRATEYGKTLNVAEYFFIMLYLSCQTLILKVILSPISALFGSQDATDFNISVISDSGIIIWVLHLWALMQLFNIGKRKVFWYYLRAQVLNFVIIVLIFASFLGILYLCGAMDSFVEAINNSDAETAEAVENVVEEILE